ncbi:MAG TPA: triosephosphate isomerase [Candidatus Onthousia faecigallinarum]|nr:triosephosphate isomerase [Candidatus Onthousia faecigallinarum]
MILALNHKSNFTKEQILNYVEKYKKFDSKGHTMIICPSSCYLPYFSDFLLGCQDVSPYSFGAYTGAISAEAFASLGVKYSIIHHSEREKCFKESLEVAKKKLEQAINVGLTPILCVGDTKDEHERGKTLEVIEGQLQFLLEGLAPHSLFIAYEPIYAIGTGYVPENKEIEEVLSMIKEYYSYPVLYGGSVNEKNIEVLKQIKGLGGFLLGGISLDLKALQTLCDRL